MCSLIFFLTVPMVSVLSIINFGLFSVITSLCRYVYLYTTVSLIHLFKRAASDNLGVSGCVLSGLWYYT